MSENQTKHVIRILVIFIVIGLVIGSVVAVLGVLSPVSSIEAFLDPILDLHDNVVWKVVWRDEFNAAAGTPINAEFWTCENGGHGWGNNELQFHTTRTKNVTHDGAGNLVITAYEERYRRRNYTSARCNTAGKAEFAYGKIEARVRLPAGQGIWPAFWMLGADNAEVGWPESGEIDIMEHVGNEPRTIYGTLHGPGYSGPSGGIQAVYRLDRDVAEHFHVFGVEWEPNEIRWYVDGVLFHSVTPDSLAGHEWVFDHDFYLNISLQVGGNWPGSPDASTEFPQQMVIDWIRVYQAKSD